ncbi:MAG: DUF427 domain-containing protein [Anaerolineae bacterium]|nr:DUF427 domain-containing protein [Anaerolineae bacterium]
MPSNADSQQPAQESVWDYPRPPRAEPTSKLIRIEFNGVVVAETRRAVRVLETSHPPVYYVPQADIQMRLLTPTRKHTSCEFKGSARYWTLTVGARRSEDAAWSYPQPEPGYAILRDHLAFYASRVDACYVDGERVIPQPGDFYGGWITTGITGPFKGGPGTRGW